MSQSSESFAAPRRPPTTVEMRAITDALNRGDKPAAMQAAYRAARAGADHHTGLMLLAAYGALSRGQFRDARDFATRARKLSPHDPEVLNVYAQSLVETGSPQEALSVYASAIRLAPNRSHLHYNKGCAYESLNDLVPARICFRRAVEIDADNIQAEARLAYLSATHGEPVEARRYADHVLTRNPQDPVAILSLATVDNGEKKYADALTRLEPFLKVFRGADYAIAQGLRGDALDALDRRDEAFAAYADSNACLHRLSAPRYEAPGVVTARQRVEQLTECFRDSAPWPRVETPAPHGKKPKHRPRVHAFLVGFPRSGTTLLEQILAAHPDVETMDEHSCLIDAGKTFLFSGDGVKRLAALSDGELERWRKTYWQHVGGWNISVDKPVFVDKLPLNSVNLCLISRLFPDAKILFAKRDPVDVVWSCFRRRFGMTADMYEFLTLEGAARYYDAVMNLCEIYREKLPLDIRDVVYEKNVTDFEGEMRGLCDFLGIDWSETMTDFAARSRARLVSTPSAPQVASGLYTHAVGQWERYREQLAPVLPLLTPWRARFGYA